MKRYLGYILLTVVLGGFPAVSYYYLKGGYDYRKAILDSVEDYGQAPSLAGLDRLQGELPDSLNGNLVVVGWLADPDSPASEIYGRTLDSLCEQFSNSPYLYLATITAPWLTENEIEAWRGEFGLPQVGNLHHILRADSAFYSSALNDFALDQAGFNENGKESVVTLINPRGTIIKHYDLLRREETIGLVRYIAAFIPLPEEEDIILERDNEL